MADIGSRDELAAMVEGKSDDEINAGVAERGTEKVLGQIFDYMAGRFQPERAGSQRPPIWLWYATDMRFSVGMAHEWRSGTEHPRERHGARAEERATLGAAAGRVKQSR